MSDKKIPSTVAIVFAPLDAMALGIATGLTIAFWLFLATVVLLIKGGEVIGPTLGLLAQYFPGYRVSWVGAWIGALYAFLSGFLLGFLFAFLRNLMVRTYLHWLFWKTREEALRDLL